MEKEIKITIERDGEAEEIQTNCVIIVANGEETARTIFLARNCDNIELSSVVTGMVYAVETIYKERPEIKAIVEFHKQMEEIMQSKREDKEG